MQMNKLIQYGGMKAIINEANQIVGSIVEYGDEQLVMNGGNKIIGHLSGKLKRRVDPFRSNEYIVTRNDQMQIDKL